MRLLCRCGWGPPGGESGLPLHPGCVPDPPCQVGIEAGGRWAPTLGWPPTATQRTRPPGPWIVGTTNRFIPGEGCGTCITAGRFTGNEAPPRDYARRRNGSVPWAGGVDPVGVRGLRLHGEEGAPWYVSGPPLHSPEFGSAATSDPWPGGAAPLVHLVPTPPRLPFHGGGGQQGILRPGSVRPGPEPPHEEVGSGRGRPRWGVSASETSIPTAWANPPERTDRRSGATGTGDPIPPSHPAPPAEEPLGSNARGGQGAPPESRNGRSGRLPFFPHRGGPPGAPVKASSGTWGSRHPLATEAVLVVSGAAPTFR